MGVWSEADTIYGVGDSQVQICISVPSTIGALLRVSAP